MGAAGCEGCEEVEGGGGFVGEGGVGGGVAEGEGGWVHGGLGRIGWSLPEELREGRVLSRVTTELLFHVWGRGY